MTRHPNGSRWFKKLVRECRKISPHIKIKRVKLGFYRLYWDNAYLHEVYKDMPYLGFELDDLDPRFQSQKYYEEYEDNAELTRNIKNFVEGYFDSIDTIRTRVYLIRNDMEFNKNAREAYQQMTIK